MLCVGKREREMTLSIMSLGGEAQSYMVTWCQQILNTTALGSLLGNLSGSNLVPPFYTYTRGKWGGFILRSKQSLIVSFYLFGYWDCRSHQWWVYHQTHSQMSLKVPFPFHSILGEGPEMWRCLGPMWLSQQVSQSCGPA